MRSKIGWIYEQGIKKRIAKRSRTVLTN
jgi:hypothetical protein